MENKTIQELANYYLNDERCGELIEYSNSVEFDGNHPWDLLQEDFDNCHNISGFFEGLISEKLALKWENKLNKLYSKDINLKEYIQKEIIDKIEEVS